VIKANKNDLQRDIVDAGLCTACGICHAVCPRSVIEIEAFINNGEPVFDSKKCTKCNTCLRSCPGADNFLGNTIQANGNIFNKDDCYRTGPIQNTYLSHSTVALERDNSASGGTVSAICRFLLDNNIVDTVIGVGFKNTLEPSPLIIKNSIDLKYLAQSKYARVPNCKVLDDEELGDSICFIGLPCHLKAIKKANEQRHNFVNKIKILIGLYCGNGLYFDATLSLLDKLGIKNREDIESIQYREGAWPGNFTLRKKDGETRSISKMTFNYLSFFYTPKRCYLCNELPSFDADIALADGWAKEGIDKRGWNCAIARTGLGDKIVNKAYKSGYLIIERIKREDAVNMHKHGMFNKHYLANLRCKLARMFGVKTPEYTSFRASIKDYCLALFTLAIFLLGNFRISRFLSRFVPFIVYEYFMSSSRKKWKKMS
jgi:coenzyme F420 hydrogenase subunit beta